MSSAALELQGAIVGRLSADTGIAAVVSGVYDHVPQGTAFPYIELGEDTFDQWDHDDANGFEGRVDIHTWSQYQGQKQVKELQGMVYSALHDLPLTLTNYRCISIMQESEQVMNDPDGITRHGVQTFRVLLVEV